MKIRNVWKNVSQPLEYHKDDRGSIVDIFYASNIEHVSLVASKRGALRGDHFHRKTTQYMLITKGALEYWYKPVGAHIIPKMVIARIGDMIETPPNEVHALRMIDENEFVVFTQGKRGGRDYESDTVRVSPSIIEGDENSGLSEN
jgi:dTDP-4-dehydrorhamnose 3,5-epimerase-like enzyme